VDAYYAVAVAAAKEQGIVQGRDTRTFGPNDKITRQEMFTITARALVQFSKLSATGDADALLAFTDYRVIQDYAKESLASLLREGLIQGNGQRLAPQGHATRAEGAVFLERIMN
ncbi:S-layer homology domain-containing protein, partial [Enterobacter quasiroggenkampii]|nr:S-layer homology domain-containing protein [Enterobacter quasiroggenkampii]